MKGKYTIKEGHITLRSIYRKVVQSLVGKKSLRLGGFWIKLLPLPAIGLLYAQTVRGCEVQPEMLLLIAGSFVLGSITLDGS